MRIGTRTELGRHYTPCGVRPRGRQQIGYEFVYLYVSVKPFTGEVFALFLPRLDKQCFGIFLEQREQQLQRKTLLVLDGAGAHRVEGHQPLIELSRLPAYAPELNPVERLFQELRRRLKFRVFESIEKAEKYMSQVLEEFMTDQERIKSLTLYPYIEYAHFN